LVPFGHDFVKALGQCLSILPAAPTFFFFLNPKWLIIKEDHFPPPHPAKEAYSLSLETPPLPLSSSSKFLKCWTPKPAKKFRFLGWWINNIIPKPSQKKKKKKKKGKETGQESESSLPHRFAPYKVERELIERGRSTVPSPSFNVKKTNSIKKKNKNKRKVYFFLLNLLFLTLKGWEETVERPFSIDSRNQVKQALESWMSDIH